MKANRNEKMYVIYLVSTYKTDIINVVKHILLLALAVLLYFRMWKLVDI